MRVLITGSRMWGDPPLIRQAILNALSGQPGTDHTIIHGNAVGADSMADAVARSLNLSIEVHPARWAEHQDNCKPSCKSEKRCVRAGHVRNAEMVASGADICLAFIENDSRGATGCARMAEAAGIHTIRYVR